MCYLRYQQHLVLGISYFISISIIIKHALFVYRSKEPAVLRPMLAQMSMISLFINILFSLGLLIG